MNNYNFIISYLKFKFNSFKFTNNDRFAKEDISYIKLPLMNNYNSKYYEKVKVNLFKFANDERFAKEDISDI